MQPSLTDGPERVHRALRTLDDWATARDWKGYDPYDLKGTAPGLFAMELARRYGLPAGRVLRFLNLRFPRGTRRLLGVRERDNAKGLGLFAAGYVRLAEALPDHGYEQKARRCLDRLEGMASDRHGGLGWGYPFDWRSRVLIPAGTPSAVVTSIVGDAFWRAYRAFGGERYLRICESVCDFFVQGLNIDRVSSDAVCFSYTPVDHFHVHNANLLVAEFLIRVGSETGRDDLTSLGLEATAYALLEQNQDGSLYYWGAVDRDTSRGHIDHYHSGFEIRALDRIARITDRAEHREAADRYLCFYRANLLERCGEEVIPKMTPSSTYPIDIHSCAEAILCAAELGTAPDPPGQETLSKLVLWVIAKMQHPEGWFVHRIQRTRRGERRVEFPYMRWGQAWMLLALAEALVRMEKR